MHYKKQLKRLRLAHKLVGKQRDLLRALELEGITAVTFHTTTQQLRLPTTGSLTAEAVELYDTYLTQRRKDLKTEVGQVRTQRAQDQERAQQPASASH